MAASLVYVTAPSLEEAERIGAMLVERRLAACVNILDKMRSMYWWEGKVERASEVVLIAKTRADRVSRLTEAVVAAHPYECPCVVVLPLVDGHPEFLEWIESEVS